MDFSALQGQSQAPEMILWYQLGCNSRTSQGEEYLKIEKVHKSDVRRLVESVNEAEVDQVT